MNPEIELTVEPTITTRLLVRGIQRQKKKHYCLLSTAQTLLLLPFSIALIVLASKGLTDEEIRIWSYIQGIYDIIIWIFMLVVIFYHEKINQKARNRCYYAGIIVSSVIAFVGYSKVSPVLADGYSPFDLVGLYSFTFGSFLRWLSFLLLKKYYPILE